MSGCMKIADEFGWPAVRVFEKEDLARNEEVRSVTEGATC